jgi:hypothetical protein
MEAIFILDCALAVLACTRRRLCAHFGPGAFPAALVLDEIQSIHGLATSETLRAANLGPDVGNPAHLPNNDPIVAHPSRAG